ncbi:hypothetical protein DNHGIG_37340 [Collibacillus ludicampi]|jgi:hypothetical protein|uniref:Uncharacterized protein n=1 Tax=Collibacillus ludicampi TaxID=2771369 RepID=A0AAV4LK08_9BACL|nr:hypothetical protein [Collibacillus ludicampi]GIM48185.1 hypothetical protein DNHGIG_37340 [Collibacillus ludicampi]
MKIRCSDCYELNEMNADRCCRCGRLLEHDRRDQTRDIFEHQHEDAPNIVRKKTVPRKVW